ncbi:MAG: SAM hydrolase/SAM-dependent halogenase family protein [Solirubrobacteraceae bacterium]
MKPPDPPVITFLSDYGVSDDFVGVCHGVIATVCPQARVIDITHGIPPQDVRAGAVVLREALDYMPRGVHLAIVDPGVGGDRRAVALRLEDGRVLVGPDNGLLWPAAEAGGGPVEAVDIGRSRFRLEPVSATFHGRDIFAPVAAQLAGGAELAQAGERCDPEGLAGLELPQPWVEDGTLVAHVLYVDRFGNLQLDAGDDEATDIEVGQRVSLRVGSRAWEGRRVRTFADVDAAELLVYQDSYRRLAVAVRDGSAAERLALAVDDEVRIRVRR